MPTISIKSVRNHLENENLLEEIENQSNHTRIKINPKNPKIANYHLPVIYRKLVGQKVAEYLEGFNIQLDNPAHSTFTIHKIANNWPNCLACLEPISLARYSGPNSLDYGTEFLKERSVNNFMKAESWLVDQIVDERNSTTPDSMNNGYFLPIPLEKKRKLTGIFYLLYDKDNISQEDKIEVQKIKAILEQQYT